ncbi:hypothetical protein GIB67_038603 [Kingdonia uniflora]|uniref:Uncharacterized protein n=1 Tax=Kingdonia uniflora TaxID=39325 RepID=A0A7J7NPK8_9MAGN|nr:hypothetical protein GIB67_038603 [Kingdonia uniflora]
MRKVKAVAPTPTEKAPKFYLADDMKKPLVNKRKHKSTKLDQCEIRASITPETILIVLAERFKGKEKRLERLIEDANLDPKDAAKQSALLTELNKHRSFRHAETSCPPVLLASVIFLPDANQDISSMAFLIERMGLIMPNLDIEKGGQYGLEWLTEEKVKCKEMVALEAQYIFVREALNTSVSECTNWIGDWDPAIGFVHYRFIAEEEVPVAYIYELQLEPHIQHKGLWTVLMQLVELIARKGPKPARVQARTVLCAFSEDDTNAVAEVNYPVEEGMQYFKLMKGKSGIILKGDHYTCVIDILGRAGRLSEALSLLKEVKSEEKIGELYSEAIRGAVLIYGLLHLLGFDHEISEVVETEMESEEEHLLISLGWKGKGLIQCAADNGISKPQNSDDIVEEVAAILRQYWTEVVKGCVGVVQAMPDKRRF